MSSKQPQVEVVKWVQPFRRGAKWVKAHYKELVMTGAALITIYEAYSLYKAHMPGLKKSHKDLSQQLTEVQREHAAIKPTITKVNQALSDPGFQEYLKTHHNIVGIRGVK